MTPSSVAPHLSKSRYLPWYNFEVYFNSYSNVADAHDEVRS